MSEVLVLVDHADGAVKKPTYELLTIAKRLGEPSAVFIGSADAGAKAAEAVAKYGAEKVYVVDDAEIKGFLVAPKAEALQQLVDKIGDARRRADHLLARGQGDRGPAGDQDRFGPDHRRGRRPAGVGSGDDAVGVRRQLHRAGEGHQGHADHHRQAERRRPRGGLGRRRGRGVRGDDLRRGQDRQDRGLPAAREDRPPRDDRGRDRGLRRPRHGRQLRADRGPRRRARRRRRRLARRGRLRLGAPQPTRSARPARPSRRSSTSPPASPAPSSTAPACRPPRRSWPINKDDEAPIFELVDFGVVGDLHSVLPAATEQINQRKG